MKNFCLIIYNFVLLTISWTYSINIGTNTKSLLQTKSDYEDLIEYLTQKSRLVEDVSDRNLDTVNAMRFIEARSHSTNRGLGCEGMNMCSGNGSCKNGACVCDTGYDYFDCSINILSKIKFKLRKMSKQLQSPRRMRQWSL